MECLRSLSRPPPPSPAYLSALVEAPTPPERYFTPEDGWPHLPTPSPPSLLPREREERELFLLPPALGEVRLEVLEAVGLRKSDLMSKNDVFAIAVLEGAAGITTTLLNEDHPRWTPDHARAFCFPTRKPHSRLYVALFDADDMDDDDPLGRVEIPLGALYPNTVYDVWAPLQNSPFTLHMHK